MVGERDGTGVLFLPILCWLLQFLSLHLLKSWHHRIENTPPGAFSLFSRRIKACSSHFDGTSPAGCYGVLQRVEGVQRRGLRFAAVGRFSQAVGTK